MQPDESHPRLLTAREVKERYGIPASSVYAMVKSGELAAVHYGKRAVRFSAQAIDAWIARQLAGEHAADDH